MSAANHDVFCASLRAWEGRGGDKIERHTGLPQSLPSLLLLLV